MILNNFNILGPLYLSALLLASKTIMNELSSEKQAFKKMFTLWQF